MENNKGITKYILSNSSAIYSLIFGFIGIILPIIFYAIFKGPYHHSEVLLGYIIGFIFAILGIAFGFVGIKRKSKKLSILGIVVCCIILLFNLVFGLAWYYNVYRLP